MCLHTRDPMEDLSVPSFSLGLDIDIADLSTEGEEEEETEILLVQSCADQRKNEEECLLEFSIQESEEIRERETPDKGQEESPPPRVLKRLRRGPPPPPLVSAGGSRPSVDGGDLRREPPPSETLYDDIEEFSSPEKIPKHCADDYPSAQSHITCSSNTKLSLLHRGFVRDSSECKRLGSKAAPASGGISTLTKLDSRNGKNIFPRLTISPIRKVNLIDSDSDDSSAREGKCTKNDGSGVSSKKGKYFNEKCSTWEAKKSFSATKCPKESFWKDFSPIKNRKLETPALDEFCKDYFSLVKEQNGNQHGEINSCGFTSSRGLDIDDLVDKNDALNSSNNISGKEDISWDLSTPRPPSYKYFYHNDPRIQTLVRQRLPHFVPLGAKNNTEAHQFGAKNLDYMSQFSPTVAGGKASIAPEKVSRSNSSKKKNKESHCNIIEASDASGSWVNPRSKITVPKDAGKRRVSADVRQSGLWFTDQNGRKVYVSKDGETSTGRAAYSKYRKETGGLRKAKRKAAAKKRQKSRR